MPKFVDGSKIYVRDRMRREHRLDLCGLGRK